MEEDFNSSFISEFLGKTQYVCLSSTNKFTGLLESTLRPKD